MQYANGIVPVGLPAYLYNSGRKIFQPIFHAETSAIYGFEALARFASDSTGQVLPKEFIPITEEAQLIVPLGKRIIRLACGFL